MDAADAPARYRAGVIGHPIAHSKSPDLHGAAYAFLGFECSYTAIDTPEDALSGVLRLVRSDAAWRGLSVTMPHKAAALAYMDDVGPLVPELGVINTVVPEGEGTERRLVGYNTDVAGIVNAVKHAGAASPETAVILGGGGTASAAVAALSILGTGRASVCVRSQERAAPLIGLGRSLGLEIELRDFADASELCSSVPLVISTLPPHGADALAASLAAGLPPQAEAGEQRVLLDVAYDPWPSALASAWSARGGVIVPGLEMLLYQAVEQVKLFTGDAFRDESAVINVMCDSVGAPRR